MTKRRLALVKALVHALCLVPFLWIAARVAGVAGLRAGPNPVETVLLTMGTTGLNILLITLAVTPARQLSGLNWLVRLRRMLGLYSFFYISLHFLTYAALDLRFDAATLLVDFTERPYIIVGMLALTGLVALAVTSTKGMQRRLGRNWSRLHRLVYAIAVLGVVHVYWQTRGAQLEPWVYAGLVAVLLGYRAVKHIGQRRRRAAASAA